MAYPISISTLKAKIHIAKNQLGLDEDIYRAILKEATGKTSCKEMNFADLMMVMHAMERRGFKAKAPVNASGKRFSKPSGGTVYTRTGQDKIVAIWITMQRHCFITDGSETALDKFINNQTKQMGMFAVTSLRFLSPQQASKVIEVLKKWHIRVMTKALQQSNMLKLLPNNGVIPYSAFVDAFDALNHERDSKREIDIKQSGAVSQ